ncbi:MAG: hypothetical protein GTN82_12855 [Candidatus Aminicenantes bacterium]|nr:hypothetical protein [Candidatus Aminicenantes bacterium]
MRLFRKNAVWKVFLGAAVIILLNANLSGAIWHNDTERVFSQSGGQESVAPEEKPLRMYVIEGAGYFLKSYSAFLLFLNKIEMAEVEGFDLNEMYQILTNSIENLEYANETYTLLKQQADVTPYNPIVIDQLLNFNYDLFQKKDNLNPSILEEVQFFLGKGKVREMYGEILTHTQGILGKAYAIKGVIETGEFPQISDLHDLNQGYAHSMLFGEYAARVAQEIK